MGNCLNVSTEERNEIGVDRAIRNQLRRDVVEEGKFFKLLLLGTGDSGKSTIFKQVKQCYGVKWSPAELNDFIAKVYSHINFCVRALLAASTYLNIPLQRPELAEPFIRGYTEKTDITPDLTDAIKNLWQDPSVQMLWSRRSEFQFYDNFEYYMDNLTRIGVGSKCYRPTFEDALRCKVRSTGISYVKFQLFGANFVLNDVGGQRGERRKWISCFGDVGTVLFVAAINEYDQTLFEDNSANRLQESLKVWEDIVNRSEFQNVGFLLFLNKYDLFKKKLIENLYKNTTAGCNLTYNGPEPSEMENPVARDSAISSCAEHCRDLFSVAANARTGIGAFSVHFTVATDSDNVQHVFRTSQDQILRKNLFETGFPMM